MSSSLNTTFTGDSSQLEAAYQKIARENVKLREQAKAAADEAHDGHGRAARAAHEQTSAITGVLTQLGSMVSVYGVIRGAVSAVNDQIKAQIDLQKQAAAAQSAMALPRANLLQNLGGNVSPAEVEEVKRTIDAAAQKGYGERGTLTTAYGELASATPLLNQKQRQETFMLSARYALQPELVGTIAAGIGDAASLTGSTDPLENLGLIAKTAQESRSTTPQAIAQFMIPAAANIKANYGDTAAESMSLVLALQDASKDAEAHFSSTFALQMAQQAQEFTSAGRVRDLTLQRLAKEKHVGPFERHDEAFTGRLKDYFKDTGTGVDQMSVEDQIAYMEEHQEDQEYFIASEQKHYGSELKSTRERIEHLRANKELGQEFVKDLHGEAKPLGFGKQLILNSQSEVAQIYSKELAGGIPTGEEAKAEARRAIANMEVDPMIQARRADLAALNTADMLKESNTLGAEKARARDARKQILNATGVTGWQEYLGEFDYEAAMYAGDTKPAEALRARMAQRLKTLEDPGHMDSFGGYDPRLPGRPQTEQEAEWARILRGYLQSIDERIAALNAQQAQQHRENQTTARQNGARAQASVPRGRETH